MTPRLTFIRAVPLDMRLTGKVAVDIRVDDLGGSEQNDRQRAAWMAAAQAGDRRAYERVLAESVGLIRAVARRQGITGALLDDVVQETLLSVHRVRHTYDPTRPFSAWLAALATRRAIDALRQRGRRDLREVPALDGWDHVDEQADASDEAERDLRARQLHEAIAELPPAQREAVHAALKEQTLAQTAAQTGRNPGALKGNLHRALKSLRVRLTGGP